MANGHPAKSGCPFLYATLPIGESNRRFSVQTPSNRSIGHVLVAWQSGILQSQDARFFMLSLRSGSLIAGSASSLLPTGESNRRFSAYTPSDRSIGHALTAWQSGILQSQGTGICIHLLPTGESNRRFSAYPPSDRSIDHALAA